jgi:hypothetical protein
VDSKSLLGHVFILSDSPEIFAELLNKINITVIIHSPKLLEIKIWHGSMNASFSLSLIPLLKKLQAGISRENQAEVLRHYTT